MWCVFLKIAPPGFAVITMFCFTMVLAGTCHSCISCGCTISRRPKFCTTHTHEACQLQALEAAPLLATTCLQTRLKPSAMLDAACCARLDLSNLFTLNVYAVFPGTTRRARRSAISRARISFLTQAQNFSTGFRSGDLAGIVQSLTFCCV